MKCRTIFSVVMAGVFGLCLFTGCAATKPGKGYTDDTPDEIQQLIKKKYKTAVFAVGTATSSKENIATEKAIMAARAEIARNFKSQIDALQKSYTEEVNDKSIDEFKQATEIFASIEISGSTVAKTMVRKEGKNGYSAKALVVVSAENMKALLDEKLNAITSFKASKAYKELEDRVAKEKEAEAQMGIGEE